jgi:Rieske Fe-S protein
MAVDDQRRKLCQATGLMLVGAALPACGQAASGPSDAGTTPKCGVAAVGVGAASAIGVGQAMFIPSSNLFVCRDSSGIYALDAECTHIGTTVTFVDAQSGFKCPLHFSTYDFNGEHPTSPAPAPLPHFAVCATDSGSLIVDPNVTVAASVRLKV